MRTSLKKLLHHNRKHGRKGRQIQPLAQLDELAKASEELVDMRDCYDSLLCAAASATNSAYEFSESLQEMGVCLLQKIAVNDDEETAKVMLMMGRVQFELQKLVDSYRSHIFQTITAPSESLVNELRTVEEMKHQCDEKRELYEYMRARCTRERGRSRSGNGENFSSQQILVAKDEFDEEATLFVFRLKSLKQGQSRSLLTQAARHHASQLSLFRKAIKTLEAVEPHVKLATQQQHIDYHFSGLDDGSEDGEDDEGSDEDEYDDDDDDDDDDDVDSYTCSGEGDKELSFDYRRDDPLPKRLPTSRSNLEENMKVIYKDSFMADPKIFSQSAPLLPQPKVDPTDRIRQVRPSASRKFHSYALPKPGDPKSSISTGSENSIPFYKTSSNPQLKKPLFRSRSLDPRKNEKLVGTENLSFVPAIHNLKSILREKENSKTPPPLTEKIPSQKLNPKPKFFSGPLISKPFSARQSISGNNFGVSTEPPQFSSGPLLRSPIQRSVNSPKASPCNSPSFNSSPRINELHELPRPPTRLIYNSSRRTGFSAPLLSKNTDNSTNKSVMVEPRSRLPSPLLITSIPLREARNLSPSRQLDTEKTDDSVSPPLSPLVLAKPRPK